MASEQTLKTLQSLHRDGYLSADFKLFGVPQTTEDAEAFMANYQRIRNEFAGLTIDKK